MPDEHGRILGITVPALPWLQEFAPGQRVRAVAPRLFEGYYGTVAERPSAGSWADSYVFVHFDNLGHGPHGLTPGMLRPLHPADEPGLSPLESALLRDRA